MHHRFQVADRAGGGQEGNLTATEVAAGWAALIQSVYHRITVRGTEFVSAKLTPHAERHGLALSLPEQVFSPESFFAGLTGDGPAFQRPEDPNRRPRRMGGGRSTVGVAGIQPVGFGVSLGQVRGFREECFAPTNQNIALRFVRINSSTIASANCRYPMTPGSGQSETRVPGDSSIVSAPKPGLCCHRRAVVATYVSHRLCCPAWK